MFKVILYIAVSCKVTQNVDIDIYKTIFEVASSELDSIEFRKRHEMEIRRGLEETSDYEDPVMEKEVTTVTTTKLTTPKPVVLREGPFYNFVVNICNVILTRFQSRKIPKYFKVLSKSLRGLGSGYLMKRLLSKFRRRLWKLSEFNGRILKFKVHDFLIIITTGKPMADEYFQAVNSIFSIWDDNKMDDYIYMLKKFGGGLTIRIGQMTRDVFEKLIFRTYYKQSDWIQGDIQLKFKLAVVEYMEGR